MRVGGIFETGSARYQPDRAFTLGDNPFYVLNQQKLAFIVGVIALLLPLALLVSSRFGVCFYHSISHFYYSRFMGGVFVGCLFIIGAFLLAYRGKNRAESVLATLAGICAFGVALFPTSGRGCDDADFFGRPFAAITAAEPGGLTLAPPTPPGTFFAMFDGAAVIHYVSAALLFAFLAWYCFAVFTRIVDAEHRRPDGRLKPQKLVRNVLYVASGTIIVLAMLAMGANGVYERVVGAPLPGWTAYRLTFVAETAALWAFGLSWMVRGRFFGLFLLDDSERRATAGP